MYQFKNACLFIGFLSTLIYTILGYGQEIKNPSASQVQIAAGLFKQDGPDSSPLLLVKHNEKEWHFVQTISGKASENHKGIIHSVDCNKGMCAAVLGPDFNHIPLVSSNDNGLSWSFVDISELLSQGYFIGNLDAVHCTQQACMAVGTYSTSFTNSKRLPLILRNDNDGNWKWVKNISNSENLDDVFLSTIACNQNFCVTAGYATDGSYTPLPSLLISKNNGLSWTYTKNISGWPTDIVDITFFSANCTAKSCVLAGRHRRNEKNRPLLMMSDESGENWSVIQDFIGIPLDLDEAELNSVSCTGNTCIAVGVYRKTASFHYFPLILTSHDDGKSWFFIDNQLASQELGGDLDAVSCNGKICVAVGSYNVANTTLRYLPLLLVSTDHGNSWVQQNVTGLLAKTSSFLNVVCTESSCNAGGVYVDNNDLLPPLLITSEDNGKSWSIVKNISGLPNGGFKSSNLFALTNSTRL